VGRKIAQRRQERGWSQGDLAKRLATALGRARDPSAISRAESGQRPLTVTELTAIAMVLGVGPADLLFPPQPVDARATELLTEWEKRRKQLAAITDAVYRIEQELRSFFADADTPLRDRVQEIMATMLAADGVADPVREAKRILGRRKS
jgi:transcriptional regulator with XRE-family HTH domain